MPTQRDTPQNFMCGVGRLGDVFVIKRQGRRTPVATGVVRNLIYREDWTVSGIQSDCGRFCPIPPGSKVIETTKVLTGETTADAGVHHTIRLTNGDTLKLRSQFAGSM